MLTIPLSFRSLFFRSSRISSVEWPFHYTLSISFSDKFNLLKLGTDIWVIHFNLFVDIFKYWSFRSLSSDAKASKVGIWFFDTLRCSRLGISAMMEASVRALELISRYWTWLNLRMVGKTLSNYFSERFILT